MRRARLCAAVLCAAVFAPVPAAGQAREVWKSRDADYRFEFMEDPMKFFKVFK